MSEEKKIEQQTSTSTSASGQHHGSHKRRRRKKKNKALQITLMILIAIALIILGGVIALAVMNYTGGKKLEQSATSHVPVMETQVAETQVYEKIDLDQDLALVPLGDEIEETTAVAETETEAETAEEATTVAETTAETVAESAGEAEKPAEETVITPAEDAIEPEVVVQESVAPIEVPQEQIAVLPVFDGKLKDGQVLYHDVVFEYNKDIRTFAVFGIDTMGTMSQLLAEQMGGQADMNMLAVLDPHKKKISLITINRNTMTTIDRYTTANRYYDTVWGQICLQHAYGTGGADSCQRAVAAIGRVMYQVPIHGYFAMNMGAISKLNDAVGGVTLTAIEGVKAGGTNIAKGQKVTLLGQDAFWYTKYRPHIGENSRYSADRRLERQKQYLAAFGQKTKAMVANDLSLPLDLLNVVSAYSVTDLSADEIVHLAGMAVGYTFDESCIYSVPGASTMGTKYEEFYVNQDALYNLILQIFYEPVAVVQ